MWLGVTLCVAVGSALFPLISIEIFLIGLVSQQPGIPWVALGAVIAVGQVAGKLVYFFAAKGSLRLPACLHRRPRPDRAPRPHRNGWALHTRRLRTWISTLIERCHRHPGWMLGTYGLSAVVGVPPFMAVTVLAGLVRMKLSAFVSAGLIGRFIRFSALAASPALLTSWLF